MRMKEFGPGRYPRILLPGADGQSAGNHVPGKMNKGSGITEAIAIFRAENTKKYAVDDTARRC